MHGGHLALRHQGQVRPGGGQPVDCGAGRPVVESAGRKHAAGRVTGTGRQVHRVLGDRAQGRRGGVQHRLGTALGLAENLPDDAVADRRLMGQPPGRLRTAQVAAQAPQHGAVRLVPAQPVQGLVIGVQRSAERLDRQREDGFGQAQPVPGVQGDVGGQRGGARRAVEQGHALALREVAVGGRHHMHEGQHLPGALLPVQRHLRQRPGQQRGHPAGELGPDLGMTADEIGKPGEDDAAHDALIQAVPAEAAADPAEAARVAELFLRRDHGADLNARARGHPVDEAVRISPQQALEPGPGLGHRPHRGRADDHVLASHGHPPERVECEVPPVVQHDGHASS